MLYYDRINISEGINSAKANSRNECMVCHYCFFNHGFNFQDSVSNGFHDLTILCRNISDIAIVTVKNVDYNCIIHDVNKSEAIHLLENYVVEDCDYIQNIHIQEINTKNRVYNFDFDDLVKSKKLENF